LAYVAMSVNAASSIRFRRSHRDAILWGDVFELVAEFVGVLIQASPAQLEDESLEILRRYWLFGSLVSCSASNL
jgi:hypothetical protein